MFMKKILALGITAALSMALLTGCGGGSQGSDANKAASTAGGNATGKTSLADTSFDTSYQPKKNKYKIYCTYKNIHSWYDAIKCGMDAAVADLKARGVEVDYEWYGPAEPNAVDQVHSIETAVGQKYDLIAVDVNQGGCSRSDFRQLGCRGKPALLLCRQYGQLWRRLQVG